MTEEFSEPEYLSDITLMFLGEDLNPSEVTHLLRLRPTQSWKRGDHAKPPRSFVHSSGGWKKSLPESRLPLPLSGQLGYWVRSLRAKASELAFLVSAGHVCTLSCYVGSSATASIILPSELQRAVASLGLELRISFFAHQNDA